MRMMFVPAVAALALASAASAQTPLKPALSPIGFLVGQWASGEGRVHDSGGSSRGSSLFTVEANGDVLLRRDHTALFDAQGKPTGGFDQIMMIYADAGAIHADYSGEGHLIHYVSAEVSPGRSVVFTSARQPSAPVFRLGYVLQADGALGVSFAMAPPGQAAFRPIATGVLKKAN
jgi:hypothetical protein